MRQSLLYSHRFLCACVCVCLFVGMRTWAQVLWEARRGHCIPWSWSYERFGAAQYWYWDPDLVLQELSTCFSGPAIFLVPASQFFIITTQGHSSIGQFCSFIAIFLNNETTYLIITLLFCFWALKILLFPVWLKLVSHIRWSSLAITN